MFLQLAVRCGFGYRPVLSKRNLSKTLQKVVTFKNAPTLKGRINLKWRGVKTATFDKMQKLQNEVAKKTELSTLEF